MGCKAAALTGKLGVVVDGDVAVGRINVLVDGGANPKAVSYRYENLTAL